MLSCSPEMGNIVYRLEYLDSFGFLCTELKKHHINGLSISSSHRIDSAELQTKGWAKTLLITLFKYLTPHSTQIELFEVDKYVRICSTLLVLLKYKIKKS